MNQGQKVFYDFIMERVREDKKEEAKALLEQSFPCYAAGTGFFGAEQCLHREELTGKERTQF
ncbi:MAG: hypothetical protein QM451_01480 [Bacillota bacterium]|mgnify:CR=1 FL=1|jgi:hypothetical protein|nr:hypothetical protein [Bacillota bacterium]HOB43906.1 hypothetical protein [Bacillota bacterium]